MRMITDKLISEEFIEKNLVRIFHSSIILNTDFEIIAVSKEIYSIFKYNENDLKNKDIFFLLKDQENKFRNQINELTTNGFSHSIHYETKNKYGKVTSVEISGFYLGLISDFNNQIILTIKDLNKLRSYQKRLESKINEFNDLVYRTYHDLKGPIATIKGLINLSHYEIDNEQIMKLVKLVEQSTSILEHRITNISNFFDPDNKLNIDIEHFNIDQIKTEAKELLDKNFGKDKASLNIEVHYEEVIKHDFNLVSKIILSKLKGTEFFSVLSENPKIHIIIESDSHNLLITFLYNGVSCPQKVKKLLSNESASIEQSINDDSVLWFYVLNSIVQKNEGHFTYKCDSVSKQMEFVIILPDPEDIYHI